MRRAEAELARLQRNVDLRAEMLHKDLAERHAQFEVTPLGCRLLGLEVQGPRVLECRS